MSIKDYLNKFTEWSIELEGWKAWMLVVTILTITFIAGRLS
jgi:hypothetical protein